MIDKTIGVIPSRNELSSFSDKRTENSKDQKTEFESHFKQLDKENSSDVQRGNKKIAQSTEDRLFERSRKAKEHEEEVDNQKVAKKRKNKLEDTEMVLNGMVSIESVNKTPDSEENLDGLEKTNVQIPVQMASPVDVENQPVETMEVVDTPEISEPAPEVVDTPITDEALATLELENNKVLETLNQDELFKKLESMLKPEVVSSKTTESAVANHVATAAQVEPNPQGDTSSSNQDESFKQSESSDSTLNSNVALGSTVDLGSKDFASTIANTNKAENISATETTDETNIKEILNQARYLVTKGGGEVSVKMSPEGMGEVHLKMMLENGKMTVEMNTQDKNVQKLIQESLFDLKSSLAAHQISVEHVTLNNKISTVQDMQQSGDSRSSSDSGRHANAGENSFAQFQNNGNSARQHHQSRERQASTHQDGIAALPLAQLNDVKKATAHRVYQSHKAQSLNAVA